MTTVLMMLMSDDEVARYGRDERGFGALRTPRGLLPLAAMDVDAHVIGTSAAIEIAQTFVNTTGVPLEATYIFPLPDRAAVHRFRMEVAGRVIEGAVDERGAARAHYDAAIAAGHRAAIAEEERAGVFTLRVGNLLAGEAAVVRLSLVGPLAVDDGEVTFRFPLLVAPRYMPGAALAGEQAGLGIAFDTTVVPDASRISPPVRLPGCPNAVRLGLRVALVDPRVRDVASSLHAVTAAHRDALVISAQPGEQLDRDFILRWRIDGDALHSSLVCVPDEDGRAGTFQITLVPPSTAALAAKPRDLVLVLDRSGSMRGWKMVAARRAAARIIDTLTSRDRFCAIAFDDLVEAHPAPGLIAATDRHRFQAVEALARVDARGGTELEVPLHRAVSYLAGGYDDRERVIVLITDGQVGNEDHILRGLAPHLRRTRVFALGIDQAVNAAFLRRLASAGGGLCELVESEDRLDAVMAKVHRRVGAPVATELQLVGDGFAIDLSSVAPQRLPDVYAGAPVTVLGRYFGSAARAVVELRGTSLGEPLHVRIASAGDLPRGGPIARAIPASWARAKIRDLEDLYAAGGRGTLESEIVALSKRYGVLSRFTAFVAVDRAAVVNPGGLLHQVVQAVDAPASWGPAAAPGPGPSRTVMASGRSATLHAPAWSVAPPPSAAPAMPGGRVAHLSPSAAPAMPGGGARFEPWPPGASAPEPAAHGGARVDAPLSVDPDPTIETHPVAPAPIAPAHVRAVPRRESGAGRPPRPTPAGGPSGSADRYIETLGLLARELDAQARGRADAAAVRLLRQRLTEWIEDLRSVGGHEPLALAVEQLVQRLAAALAAGAALASAAALVAAELEHLAAGAAPPPAPPSGRAFWK
jgi:Ca-activated chloride channel family protein